MIEATTTPTSELYDKLIALDRQLKGQGVRNRHDRATALIGACLSEGVDTGALIVSVLSKLGFSKQHVGKLLTDEAKRNPQTALWCRDADKRYRLNDSVSAPG